MRHFAPSINLSDLTVFRGDLAGDRESQTVVGLQGSPVSPVAPAAGQVLRWDGKGWAPSTPSPAVAFSRDLAGTATAQTVVGLQGRELVATAPTAGQLLQWTGSNWAPVTPPAPVSFGEDLSGTATAQTVVGLRGRPVAATAPNPTDYLAWTGGAWAPTPAVTFAQDLAGTNTAQTVVRLQNFPLAATTPSAGQVMTWNGSTWLPAPLPTPNLAYQAVEATPNAVVGPSQQTICSLTIVVGGLYLIALSGFLTVLDASPPQGTAEDVQHTLAVNNVPNATFVQTVGIFATGVQTKTTISQTLVRVVGAGQEITWKTMPAAVTLDVRVGQAELTAVRIGRIPM